ncbi:trihelix transcription factor ASIL1-like [Punica granatum]|uniref:Trihelix transcription factor ASIL1-like n=2 Tax=Punica granatum TaxID=22663 RepID=A0A6P8DJL4_PUNGR|nr:trihelix transcription factor ASIL1-like [Punica granatum]PKI55655.1 hypothetical protein CRG98_023966 [Punica granatum]
MATAASSPPRSTTAPPPDIDCDPSPPSAAPEIQSLPQPPASTPASENPRRPPPPCWSPDETVALIDIYRQKWHSLGRASLKPDHWQEVADAVASRCPVSSPPKTATQCRHKMEKLRKRYRAEIRRAEAMPVGRFTSNWVHFKLMEAMDRSRSGSDDEDNDEDDEGEDMDFYEPRKRKKVRADTRSSGRHGYYPNGIGAETASRSKNIGGFRIKIPTIGQQKLKSCSAGNSLKPNYDEGETGMKSRLRKQPRQSSDPLEEVVSAVKVFRQGFERMEKMKIEMAKEIGAMQREMEMKRTAMILESQQFIVQTLAKAISEKKVEKQSKNNEKENEEAVERIPTPEAEA